MDGPLEACDLRGGAAAARARPRVRLRRHRPRRAPQDDGGQLGGGQGG